LLLVHPNYELKEAQLFGSVKLVFWKLSHYHEEPKKSSGTMLLASAK
jgi:hypothetical protein